MPIFLNLNDNNLKLSIYPKICYIMATFIVKDFGDFMKIKALLLATTLFSTSVFATPTDKSLNELAKLTPYEDIFYNAVFEPLEMQRMILAQNLTQDTNVSDDERKKVLSAFDSYAEGLVKLLDTPAVKEGLKKSYINAAKSFTQAEVDAMITFYGSKDGQSALKKRDSVFEAYMKSASDNNKKAVEDYDKKNTQKVEDELKKAVQP